MKMKKRLLTGAVCGALLVGTAIPALAATVHYNDGAAVGGQCGMDRLDPGMGLRSHGLHQGLHDARRR